MALVLHLSDLHLDGTSATQGVLLEMLVRALGREKEGAADSQVVLFVTGDVFDSGSMSPGEAVPWFLDLHAQIAAAVGRRMPTVVIPGNHDRRWRGLVGPHRTALFDALRDRVDPRKVFVGGCRGPFLAEVVPPEFHGLEADVIAYDTTQLPHGWVSAGGILRQEDLLQAHARLGPASRHRPLVVLMHHHLIPTPLTDVSFIESRKSMPRVARWLLGKALPAIVSNADREELTMTALGAGTALSTLHTFGRPVLLLHGHKHFPTARLLRGLLSDSGDVLIASAGSGGKRERVYANREPDAARLWPSFNAVHLDGDRLHVEAVSFSPKRAGRRVVRRSLARVTRREARWDPDFASGRARDATMKLVCDEARFTLLPSSTGRREYWDYDCERRIQLASSAKLRRYVEYVYPGMQPDDAGARSTRRRLELDQYGVTHYRVPDGLRRTSGAALRPFATAPAFECVGLFSRYGGSRVRLALSRIGAGEIAPFGSETDLATARERPVPVETLADEWRLTLADCPPRTLLRLYWPLSP